MSDREWTPDDNWHDEASLQLAMPEAVKTAEQILELCKRVDWAKLEVSSRPKSVHALVATLISSLIQDVRDADAKKIDQAVFSLENRSETNKKVRWSNHCIAATVAASLSLARELVRDDNAHRGRLTKRKSTLVSAIETAADAWRTKSQ